MTIAKSMIKAKSRMTVKNMIKAKSRIMTKAKSRMTAKSMIKAKNRIKSRNVATNGGNITTTIRKNIIRVRKAAMKNTPNGMRGM